MLPSTINLTPNFSRIRVSGLLMVEVEWSPLADNLLALFSASTSLLLEAEYSWEEAGKKE